MALPVFRLKNHADKRLRGGHLWIYSNEIDTQFNSLKNIQPGDEAIIENAQGKPLGLAYLHPHTLIAGRLLSRSIKEPFDQKTLLTHLRRSLKIREQLFDVPCYRLVFGESDLLPGLVVDRFYDVLVLQISTAGMEKYAELIIEALDAVINPRAILLKNDSKMREVEGLENYIRWAKGDAGELAFLEENGVKFLAPIVKGQKTGWFYDQRLNRARLKAYVKNKRVLDVFSYIGGWGIQAAAFGASETWLTDVSAFALDLVKRQAELNHLKNIHTIQGDAFEVLEQLIANGEKFDMVILDPPAFIPRGKDLKKGTAAYQKINQLALRLLPAEGGVLITASCSMHLPAQELRALLQVCGRKTNRRFQILEQGHQGPDHPIHPAIPETEYLKVFFLFSSIN